MNILHCLIDSFFNQKIILNSLDTHKVQFVSHLYLFVPTITLYRFKTANLFYSGLSEKVMSYDKIKYDKNTEVKACNADPTPL